MTGSKRLVAAALTCALLALAGAHDARAITIKGPVKGGTSSGQSTRIGTVSEKISRIDLGRGAAGTFSLKATLRSVESAPNPVLLDSPFGFPVEHAGLPGVFPFQGSADTVTPEVSGKTSGRSKAGFERSQEPLSAPAGLEAANTRKPMSGAVRSLSDRVKAGLAESVAGGRAFFDQALNRRKGADGFVVEAQGQPAKGPRLTKASELLSPGVGMDAIDFRRHAQRPHLSEVDGWSKTKRWSLTAAIMGALVALPMAVGAEPVAVLIKSIFIPAFEHGALWETFLLGTPLFAPLPVMILGAAALALASLPLKNVIYQLSPSSMKWSKKGGKGLMKMHPVVAVPFMMVAAALEELAFRGFIFPLGIILLLTQVPLLAAVPLSAFLGSLAFALLHGYGPIWTRTAGGLIYCAVLLASGSLLFTTMVHFFFNLTLYAAERLSPPEADPEPGEESSV